VFLSQTELTELTGLKRGSAQARWLAQAGLRHVLAADGRPRVLRAEVERRMLSGPVRREPKPEPDWSCVT
jgi:hypothetical protein